MLITKVYVKTRILTENTRQLCGFLSYRQITKLNQFFCRIEPVKIRPSWEGGERGLAVGRWTCNPEERGSNLSPCRWMDLSKVAGNSTPSRCVNSQLASPPPFGILKVLPYKKCGDVYGKFDFLENTRFKTLEHLLKAF